MAARNRWPGWPRTLSAQILVGQVAVLALTGIVGYGLWAWATRGQLDHQYQQRALTIAETTAAAPTIAAALANRDPHHVIQPLAERIRRSTGAAYVVVIDRGGVRYSHPNSALIGQRVEEPVVALDGHGHVGTDEGSLGRSANGKAPVFGANHAVVGEVSAGVLETEVSADVLRELASLAIYLAVAFAVGLLAAVLLARRLRRQTFGLEPDEIAGLLQEREATLHGIREGVVAVDPQGRLTLLNDHAHHLLQTTPADVGRPVAAVLRDGGLRDLLLDAGHSRTDELVLYGGRILVGSRMPVSTAGADLGSVVTLRDRTELEQALRELSEVHSLTDALRAQQHEFSNRMHVVAGLLELGRYDDAMSYASAVESATAGLAAELEVRIDSPRVVALLVAKTSVARERRVSLSVECESQVSIDDQMADDLVSILGNLIDNAIDSVTEGRRSSADVQSVTVRLVEGVRELVIDVTDTGPGIPAGTAEAIFARGWSTKTEPGNSDRGIGLALVRELVDRRGGRIEVREGPSARFRISIPRSTAGVPR